MKRFKLATISLIAGVAMAAGGVASAQQQLTLDQVLSAVRAERRDVSQENKDREARFLAERNQQAALLNQVKNQVAAAAADLNAQVSRSIISAQFPGRDIGLNELATTEKLPTEDQLRDLWDVMIQQMAEQGKVATFNARIVQANGEAAEAAITRIGPFVAFSNGKYLTFKDGRLQFLARQPSSKITGAASAVAKATGDGFVKGAIDPALGQLLGLVVETPTFQERVNQGGPVGYLTLALSGLALVWGIFRWVSLTSIGGAVNAQVRRKKASKSNPLGRVMLAYEATASNDVETVALKLDDAILKEVPKLEGGLNFVKLIAGVAPLLGLLGTVIGMIQTFQAITLFGTGDPQIMASGISTALVTTVIGLICAIPLLLVHSFASGAARSVTQVLEEQAAGIIAEHAEGGRA